MQASRSVKAVCQVKQREKKNTFKQECLMAAAVSSGER